jgi:hypothetical protein
VAKTKDRKRQANVDELFADRRTAERGPLIKAVDAAIAPFLLDLRTNAAGGKLLLMG